MPQFNSRFLSFSLSFFSHRVRTQHNGFPKLTPPNNLDYLNYLKSSNNQLFIFIFIFSQLTTGGFQEYNRHTSLALVFLRRSCVQITLMIVAQHKFKIKKTTKYCKKKIKSKRVFFLVWQRKEKERRDTV